VFLIGMLFVRTVLMPLVRRITARHDTGKTTHALENVVGFSGAFTAALQDRDLSVMGSLNEERQDAYAAGGT
jgi:hypothetical protein